MSPRPHPRPAALSSTTPLLVCITVLSCFAIAAAVVIFVAVPDGANTGSLVALLLANLASTIPILVSVFKVNAVQNQVDEVAQDTERLANGTGDAKIRAAVAAVLAPHLIDPEAREQLAADEVTNRRNDERADAQIEARRPGGRLET